MTEELKACPFCGGAAELDSRQAYRALSSGRIGHRFAIYCTSCSADMGFCYEDIESCNHEAAEQEIVTAWNTRPRRPVMTDLTERERQIVAWLRGESTQLRKVGFDTAAYNLDRAATAIERGEHLGEQA